MISERNVNQFNLISLTVPNLKNVNKVIFHKYLPIKTIGKSAYAAVFLGKSLKDKKYVAIKIQDKNANLSEIEKEAYYLYLLKGFGIPKLLSFGISGKYKILVETLLGKTIDVLLAKNKNQKSKMKDICMIAIQILDRIEYIHNKNIIHQDIKPENFLVGNPDDSIIYAIDYGMSKKYRSSHTGKHISFSRKKKFRGTFNFSSINSMRGIEMSRRDDLESIGYMLIYLIKGELPWSKYEYGLVGERYALIFRIKNKITNEKLCEGLPQEFCNYMKYVKALKFEEEPNYLYLKRLFLSILDKMEERNDLHFSWIKGNQLKKHINYPALVATINGFRRKSPFKNIIPSLIDKSIYKKFNTEAEVAIAPKFQNKLIKTLKNKYQ